MFFSRPFAVIPTDHLFNETAGLHVILIFYGGMTRPFNNKFYAIRFIVSSTWGLFLQDLF